MPVLSLNSESRRVSGVRTFCEVVVRQFSSSYMVCLNMTRADLSPPNELWLRPECSYEAEVVAAAILAWIGKMECDDGDPWFILPNVGETCYAAAAIVRERIGSNCHVVGICHSDLDRQYEVIEAWSSSLSALAGVSPSIVKKLSSRLPDFCGRIRLLDCPVRFSSKPCGNSSLVGDGPIELLYVGRLEKTQKRVDRLVGVVQALLRKGVSFRLSIVGEGSFESALREKLREVADRSSWDGACFYGVLEGDELEARFLAADVFLLTSEYEGTPIALLEAISLGVCPVVMQIESGVSDLLVSGETAVIVDQGDVEGMAAAVQNLDAERDRLKELSDCARSIVAERFSETSCRRKLEEIFSGCVGVRPSVPEEGRSKTHSGWVEAMFQRLQEGPKAGLAVYGAGVYGRKLIDRLMDEGVGIAMWVDSDSINWGLRHRGVLCVNPERMADGKVGTIAVASVAFAEEIASYVEKLFGESGVQLPRIIALREKSRRF
ncbi:glycosyltransferase family 4 protein [Pelagicoccus sp. SDUM812003]|uniref:glycosyltransferase family 4 protein n=1 Tax=Pelagicoccus sp. SDUM812003 TaxID=3041267 RepID=UPI00280CF26C|nr:glycosyltransferase family 4 protein [Pelagicoccus sp. SDUM812003]MDQ8201576.1 glycosyltransferase family 4 protein [Pelagicoccus sp. SDUM812003]